MPGHHSKFAGWFQPKNRWTVHHLQRWRTNDVHSLKLKWMVQRLVSFWEALYSGAMLVLGSVREKVVSAAQNKKVVVDVPFYHRTKGGSDWFTLGLILSRTPLDSEAMHSLKMTASKSPWKNRPKMPPKGNFIWTNHWFFRGYGNSLLVSGRVYSLNPTFLAVLMTATSVGSGNGNSATPWTKDATWAMKKRAPGWLGYIGDEKLPSCIGIMISHYKDPY